MHNQVAMAQSQLTIAEMRLESEMDRLETLPFREADILPLISLLDAVSQGELSPAPLFARLGHTLDGGAILTLFDLAVPEQQEATPQRRRAEQVEAPPRYVISLAVALSPDIAGDQAALDATAALRDRLEQRLEGHSVTITRQPVDINPDQVIRGGFSANQEEEEAGQATSSSRYSAVYTVIPTTAAQPTSRAGG